MPIAYLNYGYYESIFWYESKVVVEHMIGWLHTTYNKYYVTFVG